MDTNNEVFKRRNRSSLFLIEVIIAVFFFTITAVICIRIFVKSHIISNNSTIVTNGYIEAENMASVFFNSGANVDLITTYYSEYALILSQEGNYTGTILICYDNDFNPIAHPADNIDNTIESSAYELVLVQSLNNAADEFADCSSYEKNGYACSATIYFFDVKLSDAIITDNIYYDPDFLDNYKLLELPLDMFLGDVDAGV